MKPEVEALLLSMQKSLCKKESQVRISLGASYWKGMIDGFHICKKISIEEKNFLYKETDDLYKRLNKTLPLY